MSSESPGSGGTLASLQRVVLGVLLTVLGIILTGSGVRTLEDGNTLVAIALLAAGLLAFVALVALFVEGYREGGENSGQ